MKKFILLLIMVSTYLFGAEITVAVAANVSYAIVDLKKEFNKTHPNTKIKVILGSSGKLTAQIKNGAPYDVFMAANMKYPEALFKDKIAINKPVVYAKGSLAYFSKNAKNFSKGINLIKDASIGVIAIANPKTAPYGKASLEAIKNAGLYENIKSKLIYSGSISQTVSYVMTAADIGFIAKSSLYSNKMKKYKKDTNWQDVDQSLYTPINQGIVILKASKGKFGVKEFYDFIFSDKAKNIFTGYGYIVN